MAHWQFAGGLGSPTRRQGAPTPRSTLAARNLAVSAYLGQRLFKPGAAPSLPESDIMGGWVDVSEATARVSLIMLCACTRGAFIHARVGCPKCHAPWSEFADLQPA
jgi:hypothetical protein